MVRAVLFDLDGTLADTERLQWQAYRHTLLEYGVDVDIDEYRAHWIAGDGGAEYACRAFRLPVPPSVLRTRKAQLYRELIDGQLPPCHGARQALVRLRPTHRLAIATNTVRHELNVILGKLRFEGLLHETIAREDYDQPKPAPGAYRVAAARLGIAPDECAVVEDTQRGLRSGLAAGMRVIVVPADSRSITTSPGPQCGCGAWMN